MFILYWYIHQIDVCHKRLYLLTSHCQSLVHVTGGHRVYVKKINFGLMCLFRLFTELISHRSTDDRKANTWAVSGTHSKRLQTFLFNCFIPCVQKCPEQCNWLLSVNASGAVWCGVVVLSVWCISVAKLLLSSGWSLEVDVSGRKSSGQDTTR